MFDALKRYFDDKVAPGDAAPDTQTRLRSATAALLLEIAWADDDFAAAERDAVVELLGKRFGLDPAEVVALVGMAMDERERSTDLYGFTHLLKEQMSRMELLRIVGLLWEVVYADGMLEAHEDTLVHKLGRMVGLDHAEIIALKLRARGGPPA
jgi:uncharacterized tellurite resistance protein B-like protein